ncbi:hypothetical protein JD844_013389 [Phrynosoma platyrhinos]|uniref:Uncharacterized protein n=1 Tax=Phrynosoma platyrhinos TaxID=52577 RepID=A0ABQ7TL48_PHRPL|nr:hypothetical protein JD844_013389 [Phrynosoma platyrhinos]
MAQKCSYSRFENSATVSEDPERRGNDLKDIPGLPKKPHESENCSLDSSTINQPDHPAPALPRQMGDAVHPPEEPLHSRVDLKTPAAPNLPEKTENCGAFAVVNSHLSCKSDYHGDSFPLQQNKRWYNLTRNSWEVKPLCMLAGPYEAKWIHHKYLYSNTRPW